MMFFCNFPFGQALPDQGGDLNLFCSYLIAWRLMNTSSESTPFAKPSLTHRLDKNQ
jgi:hypothetical protein